LTGQYSLTHNGWGPLSSSMTTVPELLTREGITTAGVVDTPFYLVKGYNYDRGFSYFYDLPGQDLDGQRHGDNRIAKRGVLVPQPRLTEFDHCAPNTMTVAEKCLEFLRDERFFLYVDTWDPHEPFNPPPWYVQRYLPSYEGQVIEPAYGPYAEHGLTEADMEIARSCYAGKLTMVDRWIGRLLDRIESLNLSDRTAIVFTSDHGFYFGERGLYGKMTRPIGRNEWLRSPLYHETSRVPLMLRAPGVTSREDTRLVSAIDIAPTLLDLMGVPVPTEFVGRSIAPLLRDQSLPGDDLAITAMPLASPGGTVSVVDDLMRSIIEWQPISIEVDDWSLLFATWDQPIELYDLNADPGQTNNVAEQHRDVVESLHARLLNELQRAGADDAALKARS